nr:uncharacterized protein LOC131788010 isoform X2 [Pocillopora verrucosa]
MSKNCRKSCNLCQEEGGKGQGGEEGNCQDGNKNCKYWASHGHCKKSANYMSKNCRKSCNLCQEEGGKGQGGEEGNCQDGNKNCKYWASHGHCKKSANYMSKNCRKSCNLCQEEGGKGQGGEGEGKSAGGIRSYGDYCVAPNRGGCSPPGGSYLIFTKKQGTACNARDQIFRLDQNGVIHHKCSGKVVCPQDNNPTNGKKLMLKDKCDRGISKHVRLQKYHNLKNLKNNFCVHPNGGWPREGGALVYWKGCDQARLKLEFLHTEEGEKEEGGEEEECQDGNKNCKYWASHGHCKKSANYMSKNCRKSCNLCQDGEDKGGGAEEEECQDGNKHCKYWASNGHCEKSANYMSKNCRKSCNLCQDGEDTEGDCQDGNKNCKYWASHGHCKKSAYYMSKNCRKSCNLCQGEARNEHSGGGEFEDEEDDMNEEDNEKEEEKGDDEKGEKQEEKNHKEDRQMFFA